MRHGILHLASAAIALSAACAWDEGQPFATVAPRLEARVHVPADRDLGQGWQALATGYEVRIDELHLDTGELALVDLGTGALDFDPANPPPGYSLCHNGHCHADDGRLVSYEEIAAELGQGSGTRQLMTLPVGELDLAAGVARDLVCIPGCDLPLAHVRLVTLGVTRVRASGLVRDGARPARIDGELPWSFDMTFADGELVLTTSVDLPADRDHDPDVRLDVELLPTSKIVDGVPWAELGDAPLYVDAHDDARAALAQALGEIDLDIAVTR